LNGSSTAEARNPKLAVNLKMQDMAVPRIALPLFKAVTLLSETMDRDSLAGLG
jgi:hypothetical protein